MQSLEIKQLSLLNFKNYAIVSIHFYEKIICFTGNNGKGKTNLLDAIYYICFCKSFINSSDSQNIKNNEPFFTIEGIINFDEVEEKFSCAFKRDDRKVFRRNKKEYEKLSEHIGLIPLVIMSPTDIFMLHDGSDVRRKFLDGIISQFNPQYLHYLQQYNKALAQRNSLLKTFSENHNFQAEVLEIWDMQLVDLGNKLYHARNNFVIDFISTFEHYYHLLSPEKENVKLVYESQLHNQNFELILKQTIQKDCAVTYTTHGVHKDDLIFLLNDKPIKRIASQGQQKTYLTALRLAQYQYLKKTTDKAPILLIDDVYDKLDPTRVRHLLNLVSDKNFGQVFITDTNSERILKIFNDIRAPFQLFEVADGNVNQINIE